ncbi:hypothetical protein Tco_1274708 [Tanacetum coccineum]
MRPFGCPLTILNTLDPLGKFDGKSDEGYLLGYSTTSKAFRVYNKRTKRVEENMHIDFIEDQPNVAGSGTQEHYVAGSSEKDKEPTQEYILLPLHPHRTRISVEDVVQAAQDKPSKKFPKDNDVQDLEDVADKEEQHTLKEAEQALKDDLERMIAQEIAAKAIDNATRQAFKEVGKEVQAEHLPPRGMVKEYHGMEYMETEEAVDEGRESCETEEVKLIDVTEVVEDKSSSDKGGNAEEQVSTARPEVSTIRPDIDAARQEDGVVEPRTPPTTTSIFDDEDITMAQTLIKMKEEKAKEKGVSIKDVDDSSRPARSSLTLKPLIAKDPKIARLVHEKKLAEMERESLYNEVQAKIDASEERKKLLTEERAAAIRNKPLTRTQLRSLMMTYLKHTCKYRHNQLNKKTFEEIQSLYIKEQERDADFVPIGSERDEKMIDKMNKKAAGMDEEEVPEESESTKVKVKKEGREENIKKRSGRRLKMKATKKSKRQKTNSDLEEEEQLRASLKIVPDEEEEIDYEVLGTSAPCYSNEVLAIPEQTATGKEISNLFMAGSLPKTT